MKFLVYSATTAQTIESGLGAVDYSYYFVLESYLPLLRQFGEVDILADPPDTDSGNGGAYSTAQYYFSFTPPNKVTFPAALPVIPVFAWEFGTLPDKPFVSQSDDWKYVLGQAGQAITHSQFAAKVVRDALGESFPVVSIPAPIWDKYAEARDYRRSSQTSSVELSLDATVIDSNDFEVTGEALHVGKLVQKREPSKIGKAWDGAELEIDFSDVENLPAYSGFRPTPDGGLWAFSERPWLVLPCYFSQALVLEIELKTSDSQARSLLQVHLGGCSALVEISHKTSRHQLEFRAQRGSNLLHFSCPPQEAPYESAAFCIQSVNVRGPSATRDLVCDDAIQWYGVHEIEEWGRWTESESCGLVLPRSVVGNIRVRFIIKSSMMPIGETFEVRLGRQVTAVELLSLPQPVTIDLTNIDSTDVLEFRCIQASAQEITEDSRVLGLGLSNLVVEVLPAALVTPPAPLPPQPKSIYQRILQKLTSRPLEPISNRSVLYTTVFNPIDGRKNWPDILKAFVFALRDQPAATLIVKITHSELQPFLPDLCSYLVSLAPFDCRIVFLHGYLDDYEYECLIKSTSFIVNASKGEGQCLPLMEFMSSGVPAIAPNNTAMADYINRDNTFIVKSSEEPAVWPQDPSLLFRTTQYRINWESLYRAFIDSFELADTSSSSSVARYEEMSEAATEALRKFCSMEVATEKMSAFLDSLAQDKSI